MNYTAGPPFPGFAATGVRAPVPRIRLAHGYEAGGVEPCQTLLWALVLWTRNLGDNYTRRYLAETAHGIACDPLCHDARRWSVVGCLTLTSFQLRLWAPTAEWPVITDDFVRDCCALLAGNDSGLWPAQCMTRVDEHARRLSFDDFEVWVRGTFEARKRAVDAAVDENARARETRARFADERKAR